MSVVQVRSNHTTPTIHDAPVKSLSSINWSLDPVSKLEKNQVKNWDMAFRFTERKAKAAQEISEAITSMDKNFFLLEENYLKGQPSLLNAYKQEGKKLMLDQVEAIGKLNQEIEKIRPEFNKRKEIFGPIEKEISELKAKIVKERNEIIEIHKQRKKTVARIDPAELCKIRLDDDHTETPHLIFKWIIAIIYGESSFNYYWPNFKIEVFKRDKGSDFLARLNGLNLSKIKNDPALSARVLEKKQLIIETIESQQGRNESLAAMFDFVALVKKICDGYEKIKEWDYEVNKHYKEYYTKKVYFDEVNDVMESLQGQIAKLKKFNEGIYKINILIDANLKLVEARSSVNSLYTKSINGNAKAQNELLSMVSTHRLDPDDDVVESPEN